MKLHNIFLHNYCNHLWNNAVGINKGAAIYLHLLRELGNEGESERKVAFYHRNSSDDRKQAILRDLQLPLGSQEKHIICVVATVSLGIIDSVKKLIINKIMAGVGVDVKVDNAVIFGLPESVENLLQEGGRPMRGGNEETKGRHGYAFFYHKGHLG